MATVSSIASQLASLSDIERQSILTGLTQSELENMSYDWKFWARPNQLPPTLAQCKSSGMPTDWSKWLLLAGRGWGKTRTGAEWLRSEVERMPKVKRRLALVGATAGDARDIMVEGESGILAVSPSYFRPKYLPSKRRLEWPNGSIATIYSADEPERLRGPNHDGAWVDELGSWRYPQAWDMLLLGLRIGKDPRVVITTTPKPIKHIKDLIGQPGVYITKGSTYDNLANLAPTFRQQVLSMYEGTRLGRQELMAEILDDAPGALWKRDQIDEFRIVGKFDMSELIEQIIVGVDPEATSGEAAAETGIIVCGSGSKKKQGYVIDDMSIRGTPKVWATQAVTAYHKYNANYIVAEVNNGGDMVEHTIHSIDPTVPVKKVHASKNKQARAEPVSSMAEKGCIHHIGAFATLEDQLCQWEPGQGNRSPDRLDAMVWAFTELLIKSVTGGPRKLSATSRM